MTGSGSLTLSDRREARGFTLLELLVALFIAAIMFAIGYGTIDQALHNRGDIRQHQRRLLALQTAMLVMERDFVQLAPRPVRQPLGVNWSPAIQTSLATSDSGAGDSADSSTGASSDSGAQPLVTFTRGGWSNPIGVERPELERVAYLLQDGTLVREHWNVLDPTLEDYPVKRDLLKHVRSVSFRYLAGGLPGARQWVENWPPQVIGAEAQMDSYYRERPMAVEVTLDTKEWGKIVRIFEVAE